MKFLVMTLFLAMTSNAFATLSTSCYSTSSNKKIELEEGSNGKVISLNVLSDKLLLSFETKEIKKIGKSQVVIHAEKNVANSVTLVIGDEFREGAYSSSIHLLLDGNTIVEELVCTDESASEE